VIRNEARHHPDLIMCRKQAGIPIGRLCEKCDGTCVICDSYVRPSTLVRICDECNFGTNAISITIMSDKEREQRISFYMERGIELAVILGFAYLPYSCEIQLLNSFLFSLILR